VVAGIVVVAAVAASLAAAAVSISRAELNGTRLRIEGTALANRTITVDGVALGASDANGNFRIERDPYSAPADCIVDVDVGDGSGLPTPAFLSGCTQTAPPPPPGATGTMAIVPGGTGHGTITSTPAGISCTITASGTTGPCQAFFLAGTVVRLDARPAADSRFLGWRGLPGCSDPQRITVVADTTINCQPGFQLRF